MSRKEINIFNMSFLDLLSGALGAVLILFIIIPKMTAEQQNELEQAEAQNEQVKELKEELAETRRQLQQAQAQMKKKDGLPSNFIDKGEVEVFILWEENVDVDLYVKNLANGEICQHPSNQRSNSNRYEWGMLTEDINNERLRGDGIKYYEIFYQPKPVSGRYQIYFIIFDSSESQFRWNGKPATVSGFAVVNPGKANEKRIDFQTVTLTTAMENHIVGTLEVTENSINLIQ
jgi:restriction endonuclease S subunit